MKIIFAICLLGSFMFAQPAVNGAFWYVVYAKDKDGLELLDRAGERSLYCAICRSQDPNHCYEMCRQAWKRKSMRFNSGE
jgi:hypothetical protein